MRTVKVSPRDKSCESSISYTSHFYDVHVKQLSNQIERRCCVYSTQDSALDITKFSEIRLRNGPIEIKHYAGETHSEIDQSMLMPFNK
jgi:hypothetical protein